MKGKGQLLLPQGKFQEIMLGMLNGGNVEVKRGWEVTSVTERGRERVSVEVQNREGRRKVLEGVYLIAADGGKSVIRKGLGKLNLLESRQTRRDEETEEDVGLFQ